MDLKNQNIFSRAKKSKQKKRRSFTRKKEKNDQFYLLLLFDWNVNEVHFCFALSLGLIESQCQNKPLDEFFVKKSMNVFDFWHNCIEVVPGKIYVLCGIACFCN
jgi:hypothetical protein